jgi:hypothetical protein
VSARSVALLLALVCAAPLARGQTGDELSVTDGSTPLALTPGSPAGAFALSGFDTVNLYNGNLNFRLPLLTISGRGEAATGLTLAIERRWSIRKRIPHEGPITYQVLENPWSPVEPGYGPGILATRYAVQEVRRNSQNQITFQRSLTRMTFISSDGTETELRDQALEGQPKTWRHGLPSINRGTVWDATDGSAATYLSDTDIVDAVGLPTARPTGGGSSPGTAPSTGSAITRWAGEASFIRFATGTGTSFPSSTTRSTASGRSRTL